MCHYVKKWIILYFVVFILLFEYLMYMTVACLVIVHIQFNTVNLIIGKCLMSLWLHSHYKPHCSILMFWLRSDLPESNCNVNASVIRHATHARIDMFLHESSVSPTTKKFIFVRRTGKKPHEFRSDQSHCHK